MINGEKYIIIEILFEYGGINLKDLVDKTKVTAKEKFNWARQTLAGFACIQDSGVFNGDIKPINIVCQKNRIKIIDFGFSYAAGSKEELFKSMPKKAPGLSDFYAPPEYLINRKDNPNFKFNHAKFDVYCWGVTFYELTENNSEKSLIDFIDKKTGGEEAYETFMKRVRNLTMKEEDGANYQLFFRKLLEKALQFNPKDRPTFSELNNEIKRIVYAMSNP